MPILNYQWRTYLALRELGTVLGNEIDFVDNTILIENDNLSSVAKEAFSNYLATQEGLIDYDVNDCDVVYYYNDESKKFEQNLVCKIGFDVQIDGSVDEAKDWIAGNGEIANDNWIIDKVTYVKFKKVDNTYVFEESIGTDWAPFEM